MLSRGPLPTLSAQNYFCPPTPDVMYPVLPMTLILLISLMSFLLNSAECPAQNAGLNQPNTKLNGQILTQTIANPRFGHIVFSQMTH